MSKRNQELVSCQICGIKQARRNLVSAALVRPTIVDQIKNEYPSWSDDGFICHKDLNRFRSQYIQSILKQEKGELSSLENEVIESLQKQETLSSNVNLEYEKNLTPGEKLSDLIASFGGSWKFIIIFGTTLVGWIVLNSLFMIRQPFDPYPYILLNLVLSCLAAIQAPIIMMSQNRQEARDRMRAENDYQINLKAELEIRYLHEKIDHLLSSQWERLYEIQEIQIDLMEEMLKEKHTR